MKKSIIQRKLADLPQNPGVYIYRDQKGEIIYIGKATNLKSRVLSYFRNFIAESNSDNRSSTPVIAQAGRPIEKMIHEVDDIETEQTDSVLEALILESNLIKKHQPKYNVLGKDDKSFSYFAITKEEFPRVLIVRKTDLDKMSKSKIQISNKIQNQNDNLKLKNSKLIQNSKFKIQNSAVFGPYTSKQQMQVALKIIRRIFPFHSLKQKTEKGCLDFQLGKCPGPYAGAISKEDYKKNINGIKMILEGKKKRLLTDLEKEMKSAAKKNEFEKAGELRNKIFALGHIRDIALMSKEFSESIHDTKYIIHNTRVEAYDISNISGQHAVGSMVVFENGAPNKSQYRKFKIKTVEGSNDVAMMKEVLLRRFKNDWAMPDLILLDGGRGHANMMGELVIELGLDVLVVAVAKGKMRKNLNFQFPISNKFPISQFPIELQNFLNDKNLVKSIMDEAHRFAISYHRKLRGINLLEK